MSYALLVVSCYVPIKLVLPSAGNMAAILEVDDNMGNTFIQVYQFCQSFKSWFF